MQTEAATLDAPAGSVGADAVADLAARLERALSWMRRATGTGGLSLVALSTLAALQSDGPMRVSELVARERITQPGMTGLVTRLVEAGLATRQADPTDGRAALVAITELGHRRVAELHADRARVLATHLTELAPAELAALLAAAGALESLADLPIRSTL